MMMQAQVAVPVLRVVDVGRAAAWYRDMLGFDVDPFPQDPPYRFAILRQGTAEVMLTCDSVARPSTWKGWDVYLRLSQGLREIHDKLATAGAVTRRLERAFYGLAECEVRDLDGYVICLSQDLADARDVPSRAEWRETR
jgi:uncharacterized glyoxalase superfamily protein PhnB